MTRAYSYLRYGACGWRWLCHVQAGSLLEREALRLRTGRHLYFGTDLPKNPKYKSRLKKPTFVATNI